MDEKLNEIVTKVCELYFKFGIKSVTMDDVAKSIGISKKTLYLYVSDKNDLVEKVIRHSMSRKEIHGVDTLEDKPINAIEKMVEVYKSSLEIIKKINPSVEFDLEKYYPSLYQEFKLKRRENIYKAIAGNLEQGIEEGFFYDDYNIDIVSKLHVSRIESLMETDIFEKDEYSLSEIFKQMFYYHLRAISKDRAIKYFEERVEALNPEYKLS